MGDNITEDSKTSNGDKKIPSRKSRDDSVKQSKEDTKDVSNEGKLSHNGPKRNPSRRGGRGSRGGRGGRGRRSGVDSQQWRRSDESNNHDDNDGDKENTIDNDTKSTPKSKSTTAVEKVTQSDTNDTSTATDGPQTSPNEEGTTQKRKSKHKKASSEDGPTDATTKDDTSVPKNDKQKRKNKKKDQKDQQQTEKDSKNTTTETDNGPATTIESKEQFSAPTDPPKPKKKKNQKQQQSKDTTESKESVKPIPPNQLKENDKKEKQKQPHKEKDKEIIEVDGSGKESNNQQQPTDQIKKKKKKPKKEKDTSKSTTNDTGFKEESVPPRSTEKTLTKKTDSYHPEASTSKKLKKKGDRTEKEHKKERSTVTATATAAAPTQHQKFGSSVSNRMRHLARDRSLPIEISDYSFTGRGRSFRPIHTPNFRHNANIRKEPVVLSSNDGEVEQIHFASDCAQDSEPHDGDSDGDRVLSETFIERRPPPKKEPSKKESSKKEAPPARKGKTGQQGSRLHGYVHKDDHNPQNRKTLFSPYMSPETIAKEVEEGKLIRGNLRINKRNRSDAYVTSDSLDHDIFIFGQRDRNRALEGDVVAVRLLDVEKIWNMKKEKMRKRDAEKAAEKAASAEKENKVSPNNENDANEKADKSDDNNQSKQPNPDANDEGSNDHDEMPDIEEIEGEGPDETDAFDEEADKGKPKYCGEIVGILDRPKDQKFAGILLAERPQGNRDQKENEKPKQIRIVWFKPTDKRTPLIAIPIERAPIDIFENADKYENLLLTATITKWSIIAQHPFGQITGYLGPVGAVVSETQAILADNQVKDEPFSDHALGGLPKTPWKIPQVEYKSRRDLRETRIFTIDPATAKDLDDAVHVIALEDNCFEVGVHIADVSYFLRKYSPLDTEARDRGTSTYLVDRVIPMLPSLLCEELCSLNPGVERLAFSVIWKMDSTGNIMDTWFGRTIIKSCAKLAYDDAQNVIDGNGLPKTTITMGQTRGSIEEDITHLYKLSQHMRKRRFENGALSINSIRLCFKLNQTGEPEHVWIYELKEANRLIEEFMLCANMSVAQKICHHFPDEALLRRHEPPIERRLTEFLKLSEELGYELDGSTAGTLQASFNAIEDESVRSVLTVMAIKPMQRAKYFCTGTLDFSKYTHYALNVPLYTHFTSPIRRYADVIVHRQLEAALRESESCGYSKKDAQEIALQCNRCRDGAKNAQDQNIELYLARYLDNLALTKGPIIRSAVVVQVLSDAFDIIVPEYGIEKRIHTDALPLHRHAFDAGSLSMVVYWKKGEPVATFQEGRQEDLPHEGALPGEKEDVKNTQQYVEDDDVEDPPCPGIPVLKPSDIQATPSEDIDVSTGMQRFKVFTNFDVLIQVNMQRSPPIINAYPINPFAERP